MSQPDTASQIYDVCDDLGPAAALSPLVAQAVLRLRGVARHVRTMERHCDETVRIAQAASGASASGNLLPFGRTR